MTPATLIDACIDHWLNIGGDDTGDTDLNARGVLHLRAACQKRWNARAWWWKQTNGNVTVDNTGKGPLPTRFSSFGKDGFAIVSGQTRRMTWMSPNRLLRLRNLETGTSTRPEFYTLNNQTSTGTRYIQVHRKPPSNLTVVLYYDQSIATIAYGATGLEEWPVDYHEAVLFHDVIARFMLDEGDTRAPEMRQIADRADREAWAEHIQGRHQAQGSPRYGAGVFR